MKFKRGDLIIWKCYQPLNTGKKRKITKKGKFLKEFKRGKKRMASIIIEGNKNYSRVQLCKIQKLEK